MQKTTWKIDYVDVYESPVNNLAQVIKSCRWSVEMINEEDVDGKKTTLMSSTFGICDFPLPLSDKFIDINTINNSIVLNWVWEVIDKEKIEYNLALDIERRKIPPAVQVILPE